MKLVHVFALFESANDQAPYRSNFNGDLNRQLFVSKVVSLDYEPFQSTQAPFLLIFIEKTFTRRK